ncbi:MAG: hypothetical protein HY698_03075 [Deltaproteobacteria bacterium]|nr:hypothetical protein [Deltaproteobacteria bacterium]
MGRSLVGELTSPASKRTASSLWHRFQWLVGSSGGPGHGKSWRALRLLSRAFCRCVRIGWGGKLRRGDTFSHGARARGGDYDNPVRPFRRFLRPLGCRGRDRPAADRGHDHVLRQVPFLVIDRLIANLLVALGMHAVSPATISLPIKLLLFVLVDGWALLSKGLVLGYA